jgi:hypothetical protein
MPYTIDGIQSIGIFSMKKNGKPGRQNIVRNRKELKDKV